MKRTAFILSSFLLFAVAAVSFGCNNDEETTKSSSASSASLSDYFKSTDWVAAHKSDANFVIVDSRPSSAYAAGHIPGAISIPRDKFYFPRKVIDSATGTHKFSTTQLPVWDPATGAQKVDAAGALVFQNDTVKTDLPQYFTHISYDIPTPAELIDILTNNGITPDTTVVSYDTDITSYGGRVAWVLKVYGHAKAYVIDGGADKWKDADKREWSTTAVTPTAAAKPYKITSYQNHRITKSDLTSVLDSSGKTTSGYLISDVRTPSEYTGFSTTVASGSNTDGSWTVSATPFVYSTNKEARPGHIPSSVFLDYNTFAYTDYLDANGNTVASTLQAKHNVQVLKDAAALKAAFIAKGYTTDKIIYNYCEGGFRSGVYTLIQLGLGYTAYNYDGSWSEWSIQSSLYPVVTGDKR